MDTDDLGHDGSGGTSRRDFLRNSALATGAVWIAPAVLSVGPAAMADHNGTPYTPPNEADCNAFYRFRWEAATDETPAKFPEVGDNDAGKGGCDPATGWGTATSLDMSLSGDYNKLPSTGSVVSAFPAADLLSVRFELPADCVVQAVETKAGAGNDPDAGCFTNNYEATHDFTVSIPEGADRKEISHIDVVFCCVEPEA